MSVINIHCKSRRDFYGFLEKNCRIRDTLIWSHPVLQSYPQPINDAMWRRPHVLLIKMMPAALQRAAVPFDVKFQRNSVEFSIHLDLEHNYSALTKVCSLFKLEWINYVTIGILTIGISNLGDRFLNGVYLSIYGFRTSTVDKIQF